MNTRDTLTHAMQTYQSRVEPERLYALAGKYWRIMLTVDIALFFAAVAGGTYMLVITFFNFNINKSPTITSHTLNQAQLTQVLNELNSRNALFQQLEEAGDTVIDPS